MESNSSGNLNLLVEITKRYIDLTDNALIHQTITDDLITISGAAYTAFNIYNEDKGSTTTVSISGPKANLYKATDLFGFELIGKEWPDIENEPTRIALASKKLIDGGNIASYSKFITPAIGKALTTFFNLGNIYSIGVYKNNKRYGNLQIIMANNMQIERAEYIEIFAGAVSSLLYRLDSERVLQAQKTKLEAITQSLNESVIVSIADVNGKIIKANQNFCKIAKYSEREVLGQNHNITNSGYHSKAFWAEMWRTITSGKTWRAEVKNKAKDGSYYWVDTTINPVLDAEGKISEYLSIRNLITDKKKYELAILDSREQALAGTRAKEIFFANMSHEIRTPMNAVIGFASLLGKTKLNDLQADYLRSINIAGELLLNNINQILDFSKIETGNIILNKKPVQLHQLVNEIYCLFSQKAKEKRLKFFFFLSKDIPEWVLTDKTCLTQILVNLVSNAVKFTNVGSIEFYPNVISVVGNTCLLEFKIIDTGVGISSLMREKIFDRFTQEDENITRDYGGSGLGLAIVKKLVEMLGGSIQVKSEKGKGSEFSLQIPLETCNAPEHIETRSKTTNTPSSSLRVLIVEDNLLNQKLISDILWHYKVKVEITDNGKNAIDLIKKYTYDIILMDIQMPVMDGDVAARIIRNELKIITPIVALTANASHREQEKYSALGFNGYLSKPFRDNEFINLLETLGFHLELQHGEGLTPNSEEARSLLNRTKHKGLTKLFDLSYLKSSSVSNIKEIIEIFLLETPDDLKMIMAETRMKNLLEVKRLAHKIKSSYSFFMADKGIELCSRIQSSTDFNEIEWLVADLRLFTADLMDALKIELTRIRD